MTTILDPTITVNPPPTDEGPPRPRRGRPPGSRNKGTAKPKAVSGNIDAKAQQDLHQLLLMGFGALTLFMAVELRPTQDELDSILLPAERIILRRVDGLGEFNPDMYDGMLIAIALVGYAARIAGQPNRHVRKADTRTAGTNNAGNVRPMAKTPASGKAETNPQSNGFASVEGQLAALYQAASNPPGRDSNPDASVGG